MRTSYVRGGGLCLVLLALGLTGCSGTTDKKYGRTDGKNEVADDRKDEAGGPHSGWWCDEHGIPEDECSMCSARVEKEARAKKDWCDKHDRALSQCFHCKPERRAFYAAKHRAKYDKEPPPIPEFDDEKPDEKKPGKKD